MLLPGSWPLNSCFFPNLLMSMISWRVSPQADSSAPAKDAALWSSEASWPAMSYGFLYSIAFIANSVRSLLSMRQTGAEVEQNNGRQFLSSRSQSYLVYLERRDVSSKKRCKLLISVPRRKAISDKPSEMAACFALACMHDFNQIPVLN